jgi:hypothetical protein
MRPLPVIALGVVLLAASALAVAGCGTSIGTTTSRNSYMITEPVTSPKIDNPVGNTQMKAPTPIRSRSPNSSAIAVTRHRPATRSPVTATSP